MIGIFTEGEGDGIKIRLPFKIVSTLIGRIVIDGNFCFNLVKMVVLHDVSLLGTSGFCMKLIT